MIKKPLDDNLIENNVSTILFDQYSRYKSCADIINCLCKQERSISILDVGSGESCLLGSFLPQYNITYLDPLLESHNQETNKIPLDIWAYKCNEEQYDYVVTIDTYEHIPPEKRKLFLDKITRLAGIGVIIACPCYDAGDAVDTDKCVNDAYMKVNGESYKWLSEHFTYGLPNLSDIQNYYRDISYNTKVFSNGHTPWLKKLLPFIVNANEIEHLHDLIYKLSSYFNRHLYAYDHIEPVYRQIVVASKYELNKASFKYEHSIIDERARDLWNNLSEQIPKGNEFFTHEYRREVIYLNKQISESAGLLNSIQNDVKNVSEWALTLKAEGESKDKSIIDLQSKLQEITDWVLKLKEDVEIRDSIIKDLQLKLQEVTDWAIKLKNDVEVRDNIIKDLQSKLTK